MTASLRWIAPPAAVLMGVFALPGCQTAGGGSGRVADAGGATISVEAVNGPSDSVRSALRSEISAAAATRRVTLVGSDGPARWRVIGYLSSEPTPEGGTAVAFVWDVFSADKRLAKRVSGAVPVRNAAALEELDGAALRRIADESMNEIATAIAAGPDAAPSSTLAAAPEADEEGKPALGFVAR